MTREEAIIELKRKITCTIGGLSKEEYNATVMAIEALQREEAEEKGYCHRIKPKEYFSTDAEWTYLSGSKGSYMTISCPICGSTFDDVAEWKYHFCPNCGAKMNKGGDTE